MPRQVDHEERRREIALGVFAVIADKGMAAVSLRNVAAAAGISMGRVQHYFATKDEMVHHACRVFLAEARQQQESVAGLSRREQRDHLLTMGIPDDQEQRVGSAIWYSFVIAAVTDRGLAEIIGDGWASMARVIGGEGLSSADVDALAALVDGLSLRVMLGQLTSERARAVLRAQLADALG